MIPDPILRFIVLQVNEVWQPFVVAPQRVGTRSLLGASHIVRTDAQRPGSNHRFNCLVAATLRLLGGPHVHPNAAWLHLRVIKPGSALGG